jgi:hypothetical protein
VDGSAQRAQGPKAAAVRLTPSCARYNASLGNWRGGPVTRRQAQKSRTGTSPIPKKSILCGCPAPLAPGCFLVGLLFRCAQIVYVSICLRLNDASGCLTPPGKNRRVRMRPTAGPGPIQAGKDALSQSTDAAERKIRAQYQPPLFGSACASQHIAPEQSVQDLPEPRGDRLCSNPLLRFSQSQQGSPCVCLYFGQRRLNARLSKRFA